MAGPRRVFALTLLLAAAAAVEPDQGFDDTLGNFDGADSPTSVTPTGAIPTWLTGAYYLNSPAVNLIGERGVDCIIDAAPRLYKWKFNGAADVVFSSKILPSTCYNLSYEASPPSMFPCLYMGNMTNPKQSAMEKLESFFHWCDNTGVTVWDYGPDHFMGVTEMTFGGEFVAADLTFAKQWDLRPSGRSTSFGSLLGEMMMSTEVLTDGNAAAMVGQEGNPEEFLAVEQARIAKGLTRVQLKSIMDLILQSWIGNSHSHHLPGGGTITLQQEPTVFGILGIGQHKVHIVYTSTTMEITDLGYFGVENVVMEHSFVATRNMLVFVQQPAVFAFLEIIRPWSNTLLDIFHFDPEEPVPLVVIGLPDDVLSAAPTVEILQTDNFFFWHTVNAWNRVDEGGASAAAVCNQIVFDVKTYEDSRVMLTFLYSQLSVAAQRDSLWDVKQVLRRFTLRLSDDMSKRYGLCAGTPGALPPRMRHSNLRGVDNSNVAGLVSRYEYNIVLPPGNSHIPEGNNQVMFTLPTYDQGVEGRPYCHAYGVTYFTQDQKFGAAGLAKLTLCDPTGAPIGVGNDDTLVVKQDLTASGMWYNPGQIAFEPWFVQNPDDADTSTDDGVLMSRIYDGVAQNCYLLVLDAKNVGDDHQLTELARVTTKQKQPFALHARYL